MPPVPPPPEVVTLRWETPEPIVVPAMGDAFDFLIRAVFSWTANRITYDELRYRVHQHSHWANVLVRERTATIARTFAPHRSHELQRALNADLGGQRWPRGADGPTPRFSVHVWVTPDPRVRERLRPYWEERIRLECEHELGMLRTEQADEMTRRWRDVLESLDKDPVTSHAARLTGERFAKVFGEFVQERNQAVPDLITLLEYAVKGHGDLQMGPSEYTEAWDVALQAYRRQHGLVEETA
ncbi:hypothetical protein Pen02_73360 [Plantactinospora endophytica]|uniref:Uncharacterized protein n=1 Tax=Plantactinospora endophytica TaxID=673535 RepID=A0ABQ4ECD4_9ACTN|nr:hypothetical protein Pen02_73360 [Plantactinospora endophytica]